MGKYRKNVWRALWLAFSTIGLLAYGIGGFLVLIVFAHAGMINPRLPVAERRAELLVKLTRAEFAIPSTIGVLLIAFGAWAVVIGVLAFYSEWTDMIWPPRWSIIPPAVAATSIVALALYLSLP